MRGVITSSYHTPSEVLCEYINTILDKVLIVKRDEYHGGNINNIIRDIRGNEIRGRMVESQKLLWLETRSFREYCTKQGDSAMAVIHALNKDENGRKVVLTSSYRLALGKGLETVTGKVPCFSVDLSHPDVAAVDLKPSLRVVT